MTWQLAVMKLTDEEKAERLKVRHAERDAKHNAIVGLRRVVKVKFWFTLIFIHLEGIFIHGKGGSMGADLVACSTQRGKG